MKHLLYSIKPDKEYYQTIGLLTLRYDENGFGEVVHNELGSTTYLNSLSEWPLLQLISAICSELGYLRYCVERPIVEKNLSAQPQLESIVEGVNHGMYMSKRGFSPDYLGRNCLSDISWPTFIYTAFKSDFDDILDALSEQEWGYALEAIQQASRIRIELVGADYINKVIICGEDAVVKEIVSQLAQSVENGGEISIQYFDGI